MKSARLSASYQARSTAYEVRQNYAHIRCMTNMTHPEERALHVEGHLVVIQTHYPHETLKSTDLYGAVRVLRRLAHNLHNVVPLALYGVSVFFQQHGRVRKTRASRSELSLTNSNELKRAVTEACLTSEDAS